jgi:hypothetical protein
MPGGSTTRCARSCRDKGSPGDRRDRATGLDPPVGVPLSGRGAGVGAGNPESVSDVELVQQARAVLDRYYAGKLAELHALFERRAGQNRTSSDVATVARLVTQGAVDTLFVDIDGVVLGQVDEDGAVRFGDEQVPGSIGVVDEIARRGWLSGARLLAVRRGDMPGGGDLAAILRYAT